MRRNNLRTQFGILAIVAIATFISACSEKSSLYSDNSLNLIEPVEIISWKSFADGGSIEITFKDSQGKRLTVYYDLSGEGSKENRHIYIGSLQQDHVNSKQVPIGSAVEIEIIAYVSKWMESNFPDFRNDPKQIYQDSEGKIIASAAIIRLIEDLTRRTQ